MDKMNYVMYYEFDNFDDLYECRPCVRHGTTFQIFDCIVKFYRLNNEQITFWVNGENHTKEEAEEIFEKLQNYFRIFWHYHFIVEIMISEKYNGIYKLTICWQ